MLGVRGIMTGFDDMTLRPHDDLTDHERQSIQASVATSLTWPSGQLTRGQAALWLMQTLGL